MPNEAVQDVKADQFIYLSAILAAHSKVKGAGITSFRPGSIIGEQNRLLVCVMTKESSSDMDIRDFAHARDAVSSCWDMGVQFSCLSSSPSSYFLLMYP